jgi:hypothetical protein
MKVATRDRGEIIHFAGFHALSPALRDGVPVFVSGHDAAATRCGWATFFRAMGDRGLGMAFDPEDGGSAELRPVADLADLPSPHESREGALDHARRFLRALSPAPGRADGTRSAPPRG